MLIVVPDFAATWPDWAKFLIGTPLRIVVILLATLLVAAVARSIIRHSAKRMSRVTPALIERSGVADPAALTARRAARMRTLSSVLTSVVVTVTWIFGVCLILESLGVNVTLIITSLGVAGVAVGLGAQTLIKDVVAGCFMLIEDQYGLGDTIDAGPASGVVEAMSLRVTTLRDPDGIVWYIPNGSITRIGNKSQDDATPPKATE
ncbi:MAG: mechanosensitive ion channel family protein [Bifidobacteriaceae bacterium]|jgi:small conductance mechanosensitive channel|nr:mechanosensitive ion channel family protein [Bifidobacteriaceae bacterium]